MSVRLFCIDGTNLIRTAYGYGGPAHATQEDADTRRITELFGRLCEDVGESIEVELFFDGAFRDLGGPRPDNFRLSFTREVPADDVILDRIRARGWNGGGTATVVTADGDLGRQAEAEGGKWLRVSHGAAPEGLARKIGGRFLR